MAEQMHKQKQEQEQQVDEIDAQAIGDIAAKGADVKAELDDLLDEIDGVLEENAEDFVKSYIQKGGQ